MTRKRQLSEMLVEVFDSTLAIANRSEMRTTSMELTIPIDLAFESGPDGPALLGELPQFITRTDFDRDLGRLHIVVQESKQ